MTDSNDPNKLYEQYKSLTSKDRNERLQALFSAKLEERDDLDDLSIELFNVLIKSFDKSIKFDELSDDKGDLFGTVKIDIRAVRNGNTERLGNISESTDDNAEPLSEEGVAGSTDTTKDG